MNYTPIVICGMGRSGTRNVADNIARHPKAQIYGEIPPQMMDSFLDFYRTVNNSYKKSQFANAWEARKEEFFFDCLNNISKEKIETKKHSRQFVGYKSPKHERFYKKIESCFSSEKVKPYYIYCVRDAFSCWKSYKSMEWNKLNVESFVDEYVESLRFYFSMLRELEDRVITFNLNEYKACHDKASYFKVSIMEKFGMSEGDLNDFSLDERNRNATKNFIGKDPNDLPEREKKTITQNKEIIRINNYFGF